MAQALMNNLNITKDSSFQVKDGSSKTASNDFAKIFDTKTNSENLKRNEDELNTDIQKQDSTKSQQVQPQKVSQTTQSQESEGKTKIQKENLKTLGDIKNQSQKNKISDSEEEENAVLQDAAESVIDLIIEEGSDLIITEETSNTKDEKASENNSDNNDTDKNDTDEDNTQQTNITEEDSTMYKEINAPENPATIMLLSQIQTNVVKLPVSNISEQAEQKNTNNNQNEKMLELNTAKQQFDEMLITKDIPTTGTAAKEIAATKTEQPKQAAVFNEKMVKELNIESVESETEQNTSSGNLMQNQTPQEQTVKIMIQGDIKADAKIEIARAVELKPTEITPSKIIEQISKQLDSMYNNSKLNMVLNPGTLGKLHLHIMNTKDGLIAQFTVTTQEAKDVLMKGLNGLKDTLLAHGITVDNVSVKLEESENNDNSDWTEQEGSRGGNKQQGARKQKEEEKPFEQMMFEMENNDNLV